MIKQHEKFPVIGFSTNVFDNPAQIEDTVENILQDFSAIEIELEDDALKRIEACNGIEYSAICDSLRFKLDSRASYISVHAPYLGRENNLASYDEEMRKIAIEKHKFAIKFCADLSGTCVTFHPGFNIVDEPKKNITETLIRSIEELRNYADNYNINLCLENMGNERPKYLVYSAEEHLVLHQTTGIYVTLDLVHLGSWGLSLEEIRTEIQKYAPITKIIHFNDMPENKHRHIPLGTGILPIKEMLACTKEYGFNGPAIIDEFARPISPNEYLKITCDYFEELVEV